MPPTERKGRVHTSTVTVAVIVPGQARVDFSPDDCRVEWYSGSGAGGQHRNKHQNSCRVIHVPTGTMRKAETRHRETSYREALEAVRKALSDEAARANHGATNATRRDQVGSGMRGHKRRTYRFQDDEVVDHITGKRATCSRALRGQVNALW